MPSNVAVLVYPNSVGPEEFNQVSTIVRIRIREGIENLGLNLDLQHLSLQQMGGEVDSIIFYLGADEAKSNDSNIRVVFCTYCCLMVAKIPTTAI